jgi:hypothetical protein
LQTGGEFFVFAVCSFIDLFAQHQTLRVCLYRKDLRLRSNRIH